MRKKVTFVKIKALMKSGNIEDFKIGLELLRNRVGTKNIESKLKSIRVYPHKNLSYRQTIIRIDGNYDLCIGYRRTFACHRWRNRWYYDTYYKRL